MAVRARNTASRIISKSNIFAWGEYSTAHEFSSADLARQDSNPRRSTAQSSIRGMCAYGRAASGAKPPFGKSFRSRHARGTSPGNQRAATQPGIGTHLIQDELGNVLARDASAMEIGEILDRFDGAAAGLVVQDGGANES